MNALAQSPDTLSKSEGHFDCLRPRFLHPVVLYVLPWVAIAPLYSLAWSSVLIFDASTASRITLTWIVMPLVLSWVYWQVLSSLSKRLRPATPSNVFLILVLARWMIVVWVFVSVIEVVLGHGTPLYWLWTHQRKTAQDFGIPSIHGLVNSLLLGAATFYVYAGLVLHRRRYYTILLMAFIWSVIVVSRELMMVLLVQSILVYLQQRKVNGLKITAWLLAIAFFVLLIFGIIGDFRSPLFTSQTAGITRSYPAWLPSGFIWIYMYMTTPLNNLINTINRVTPAYDWAFPDTLAQLFPTVIRNLLFPKMATWTGAGGLVVTNAFNVSSAYAGPVQDFGLVGTAIFAWLTMGSLLFFWRRKDLFGLLGYALLGQCAFFSIFFNHFFYLPVIFQLVWFSIGVSISAQRPATPTVVQPREPASVVSGRGNVAAGPSM